MPRLNETSCGVAAHPSGRQIPKLDGVDPDDAFSTVPYEKGFNFLYYLQTVAGGAEAFDPFFQSYIKKFAGKTVTSGVRGRRCGGLACVRG